MSEDIFQLPQPGPAKPDVLRVVPLGGLGEVGRNMTVLETEGKILIVDCGVLFPEEIQPGVDLILPDFTYIQDRMAVNRVASSSADRDREWRMNICP